MVVLVTVTEMAACCVTQAAVPWEFISDAG